MSDDNKPVEGAARRSIIESIGELRVTAKKLGDVQKLLHGIELECVRALEVPRIVAADIMAPIADSFAAALKLIEEACNGNPLPNSEAETNKNT